MLNLNEHADDFQDQKTAKEIGGKCPTGRYHMVATALKFKKGVSRKSGKPFTILIIYARALALIAAPHSTEKRAKLSAQGNGSQQFEIFWNLESDLCKRDLSWWLLACGLDPNTSEFDAADDDVLAKGLLYKPFEVAFAVEKRGEYDDVKVKELKTIDPKLVKKYKDDPDFESIAKVAEDDWYEVQDMTQPNRNGGGGNAANNGGGDPVSQDDLDNQFGDEW